MSGPLKTLSLFCGDSVWLGRNLPYRLTWWDVPQDTLWRSWAYSMIPFDEVERTPGYPFTKLNVPQRTLWRSWTYPKIPFDEIERTPRYSWMKLNVPEDTLLGNWTYPIIPFDEVERILIGSYSFRSRLHLKRCAQITLSVGIQRDDPWRRWLHVNREFLWEPHYLHQHR